MPTCVAPFKPLTREDIADVLSISLRTVHNWLAEDLLPSPVEIGGRVYWHPDEFYAWLDRRLRGANAAADCSETEGGASLSEGHCESPEPLSEGRQLPGPVAQLMARDRAKLAALRR